MREAALYGTDLQGATLDGAHLLGAGFEGAHLTWEKLAHARFELEDLIGAFLYGPIDGLPTTGYPTGVEVDRELVEHLRRLK